MRVPRWWHDWFVGLFKRVKTGPVHTVPKNITLGMKRANQVTRLRMSVCQSMSTPRGQCVNQKTMTISFPFPQFRHPAQPSADLNVASVFRLQARTERQRSLEHCNTGNESHWHSRLVLCTPRALCFTFRTPRDFTNCSDGGPSGRWEGGRRSWEQNANSSAADKLAGRDLLLLCTPAQTRPLNLLPTMPKTSHLYICWRNKKLIFPQTVRLCYIDCLEELFPAWIMNFSFNLWTIGNFFLPLLDIQREKSKGTLVEAQQSSRCPVDFICSP